MQRTVIFYTIKYDLCHLDMTDRNHSVRTWVQYFDENKCSGRLTMRVARAGACSQRKYFCARKCFYSITNSMLDTSKCTLSQHLSLLVMLNCSCISQVGV